MKWDPAKVAADLQWLKDHAEFIEKPASIIEFLGSDYLNIEKGVRQGVKDELIELFGLEVNHERIAKVRWAMFTGAIGIGKTTLSSICIPYMVHWVLCLRDPQGFYDLLPGSRIAFMQMSTSEDQAKETVFGDIKARIQYSPWFANHAYDKDFKNQLRFEKEVWIIPGSSAETSFEGYNILGGILDEADSHKITKEKDYAEAGFDTINGRIDSRFQDKGFLIVVGQMKKANGFAARKYKELKNDPEAHTVKMTIWESLGWHKFLKPDGTRDSFWYDSKRKQIVDDAVAKLLGYPDHLIEIPNVYKRNFVNNPEKALRDLAGIPPLAGSAFISRHDKIEDAIERWVGIYGEESPIGTDPRYPQIADWFRDPTPLKRAVHLDIGYSANGDAAGLVMGHIMSLIDTEEEKGKPFIVIDAIVRVRAASGSEVQISDLRNYIYEFGNRGFRIKHVTMDGFQSTDTRQQLKKRKLNPLYLSIDKSKLPYEDLRDALYEDRIAIPPYMTYLNIGDTDEVNIAFKELSELEEDDRKIDHPSTGSKDVADGIAGVCNTLMGDRAYRRNVASASVPKSTDDEETYSEATGTDGGFSIAGHHMPGLGSMGAPIPPNVPDNVISMPIPPSLRPR